MSPIWKSVDLEEGQYSDVMKVTGVVTALTEGSWGADSAYGDRPFIEVVVEQAKILAMRTPEMVAPPLEDDEFRFRINASKKKNSKWGLFLTATEALGIELPDGLVNRKVTFISISGGRGKFTYDCLVPAEVEELKAADPLDRVLQFLGSTDKVKVFKRACLLDPLITADPELVDAINSDSIFGECGYQLHEDGVTYFPIPTEDKPF